MNDGANEAAKLTRQLSLDLKRRTRGGVRAGAGRPRKKDGERAFVAHRTRAPHRKGEPVHVTLRVVKRLPSLRRQVLAHIIERAMLSQRKTLALEAEKAHFQLVHFSIQEDHLHLLVEAPDKRALARGLMGLEIRIARRINKALGRNGRFWADRYHRHDLRTPTETRNAIRYVLFNIRKHQRFGSGPLGVDPLSSAATFDGFARAAPANGAAALHWPPVSPRTWLLEVGWRRHGLIDPDDAPWSTA